VFSTVSNTNTSVKSQSDISKPVFHPFNSIPFGPPTPPLLFTIKVPFSYNCEVEPLLAPV
jgi:hypothetical protein